MGNDVRIQVEGSPAIRRRKAAYRWNAELGLSALYLASGALVAVLVGVPLIALLVRSLTDDAGRWTLANYAAIADGGIFRSLLNTLAVGIASAAFATVLGSLIAWIVTRTDFRYKATVTGLLTVSFFFPSFILAMAWIILGAPGGIFNYLLGQIPGVTWRLDIYSLAGIVWVQTLHVLPFTFLMIRAPLANMNAEYEEAARTAGAGAWQTAVRVVIPLLRFPLLSALLLSFVLGIEQFAIPAMIGIPGHVNVFSAQLYLLTTVSPPHYGLAATIGLGLSILMGLAILVQRRMATQREYATVSGKTHRVKPTALGRWRVPAYLLCFGSAAFALLFPSLALVYTSFVRFYTSNPLRAHYTLDNYSASLASTDTWSAFGNTLLVCGIGATLGVVLALLIAYFAHRLRPPGYRILDIVSGLPFGIPGIVIGLGLVIGYTAIPLPIYGTIWILIASYVTRFLPLATETIGSGLTQLDRSLEEAAWSSGSGRLATLARIIIPLLRPSIQSAWFILFMVFFREISSAVLLYTTKSVIVSISIWNYFTAASWNYASALSVIAGTLVAVILGIVYRLTGMKTGFESTVVR